MKESTPSADLSLDQRMKEKIAAIAAIANDLPSVIIIINLKTLCVEYMSERGLAILRTTIQELKDLGSAYFDKYFNPEDAQNYVPKLHEMLRRNDPNEVISFFQQVRGNAETEWGWYLTSCKVFMCDDEGQPYLSINTAHPVEELKSFTYKIERLLEEKAIMRTEIDKYALLSKREKEIIILLVAGHSSVAIAEKLFIASSTVEQHRKNIKNKLGIKNLPEMVRFAQAFNMEVSV